MGAEVSLPSGSWHLDQPQPSVGVGWAGARQWAPAEAWRGEAALVRGSGRAGWEQRLPAPLQLQIIPHHKQPVGGSAFALAGPPWLVWEEEERHLSPAASICP